MGFAAFAKNVIAGAVSFMILSGMVNVKDYNAVIHKGGYFGAEPNTAIIRTAAELDNYINEIMRGFGADSATAPFLADTAASVRESYKKYDGKFFAENNLVVATVGRGSGSVRYSVGGITCENGVLTVNIKRQTPMIMTMDYVHWVLTLQISKSYKFASVEISLNEVSKL